MGTSVIITTPMPTAEEVADRLGLSQERRTFLRKLAETTKSTQAKTRASTRSSLKRASSRRKAA